FDKIKRIGIYGTSFYVIILTPIYVLSDDIVILLGTYDVIESSIILKILILLPITIFLNNLFGTQILLNLNKDKLFFKILLFTALINLILIFPLTYYYNYIGTSIAVLITELLLFVLMYIYAIKSVKQEKIKYQKTNK